MIFCFEFLVSGIFGSTTQ